MSDTSPVFSVVVPLYNTECYIAEALRSVEAQTFTDFEVIIVDDGSLDNGPTIARGFVERDPRFRLVTQANRGLSGARNSGIREARGKYIALLDADDVWLPEKLQLHFAHLEANERVGISYAPSVFIDDGSRRMRAMQNPRLDNISAEHIFCRNPIGNGSAPVLRRALLDELEFCIEAPEGRRSCWFDETFRQSEDIEMWTRAAVQTDWTIAGIAQPLTLYRLNSSGLSGNVEKQYDSWCRFRDKIATIAPDLVAAVGRRSEAFQLRYLARRAAIGGDGRTAMGLLAKAFYCHPIIVLRETDKTLSTMAVALLASMTPKAAFRRFARLALGLSTTAEPSTN